MNTPKAYWDNLKKRIITVDMLSDCIYSVNKRAKNCRDKEKEYRNRRYDTYFNEWRYRDKKEKYYKMKDEFLSLLSPTCIHEAEDIRTYSIECDDEDEYKEELERLGDTVINSYSRKKEIIVDDYFEDTITVYVIIYNETNYNYFLYYDLNTHSFHTPIDDYRRNKEKYSDLKVVNIGELSTHGKEINDLISMNFVKKVLDVIRSGDYDFQTNDVLIGA